MPALSGVEVGRFMKRNQKRHIPIIIHSSQPEMELEKVAEEIGAAGFLRKGISSSALRTAIARQLSRR
jgi:CheY-like chemotaxis protein